MNTGNPSRRWWRTRRVAATGIEYFAGLVTEIKGATIPMGPGNLNYTLREPLGVVARIVAYNHPLMFAAVKIGAPLAAGNTVIVKAPEQAPLSALQNGGADRRRVSAGRVQRAGRRQGVRAGASARIRSCAKSR